MFRKPRLGRYDTATKTENTDKLANVVVPMEETFFSLTVLFCLRHLMYAGGLKCSQAYSDRVILELRNHSCINFKSSTLFHYTYEDGLKSSLFDYEKVMFETQNLACIHFNCY